MRRQADFRFKLAVCMKALSERGGLALVFPATPSQVAQRWFLRTSVNGEMNQDLVFLGINPSSATQFAPRHNGGDPTTEMVLRSFKVNEDGSPQGWRSMTILNLIPIVGQPRNLPIWDGKSGRQAIIESVEITRHILRVVLPESYCLHLMWGNPGDKNFPWKRAVLEQLTPEIGRLFPPAGRVQAYISKSEYPLRPGFGGLHHWRAKPLREARHLL